jgi:DNA polymerase sigma
MISFKKGLKELIIEIRSSDNGLASKNSDVDMCITSSELQSIMAIEDQEQRRKLLKRNVYQLGAVLRSSKLSMKYTDH